MKYFRIVLFCLLSFLIAACPMEQPEEKTGNLVIVIEPADIRYSIPQEIQTAEYRITFAGETEILQQVCSDTAAVHPEVTASLPSGTWSIKIEGLDVDGHAVSCGNSGTLLVPADKTIRTEIPMFPVSEGSGTIDITVTWSAPADTPIELVTVTVDDTEVPANTLSTDLTGCSMIYCETKNAGLHRVDMAFTNQIGTQTITETVYVRADLTSAAHIIVSFTGIQPPPPPAQIIADHTAVEQFVAIPAEYVAEVKKMWFNLPGESHSQGYRTGLGLLAAANPVYATDATSASTTNPPPIASTGAFLRSSKWTSFNTQWYVGEAYWFTNSGGIAEIKGHLDFYNSGSTPIPISAFGFGWCWDMTRNSPSAEIDPVYRVHWYGSTDGGPEGDRMWGLDSGDTALTGNSVCMDTYLAATQSYADYCVSKGYPTKVFFTTGPADETGETGYQRELKHEYIRTYVRADASRILFDYADILSWSGGEQATASWTDGDGTVHVYPVLHPDYVGEESGGHINNAGAVRLGKAVWWMMARIAGWDGN